MGCVLFNDIRNLFARGRKGVAFCIKAGRYFYGKQTQYLVPVFCLFTYIVIIPFVGTNQVQVCLMNIWHKMEMISLFPPFANLS